MDLVAGQNWQQVLVRAVTNPSEIHEARVMELYGVYWELLPVHLACALKPPIQVVQALLGENPDTIAMAAAKNLTLTLDLMTNPKPKSRGTLGRISALSRIRSPRKQNEKGTSIRSPTKALKFEEPDHVPSNSPNIQHQNLEPINDFETATDPVVSPTTNLDAWSATDDPNDSFRSDSSDEADFALQLCCNTGGVSHLLTDKLNLEQDELNREMVGKCQWDIANDTHCSKGQLTVASPTAVQDISKLDIHFTFDEPHLNKVDEHKKTVDPETVHTSNSSKMSPSSFPLQTLASSKPSCITQLSSENTVTQEGNIAAAATTTEANEPSGTKLPLPYAVLERDQSSIRLKSSDSSSICRTGRSPSSPAKRKGHTLEHLQPFPAIFKDAKGANLFLPLHIACLFRSSPKVIQLLLRTNPEGARTEIPNWGMLPIHIICAGLVFPPPISTVPDEFVNLMETSSTAGKKNIDNIEASELESTVSLLCSFYPESVHIPSNGSFSYTPLQLIMKRMPGRLDKKLKDKIITELLSHNLSSSEKKVAESTIVSELSRNLPSPNKDKEGEISILSLSSITYDSMNSAALGDISGTDSAQDPRNLHGLIANMEWMFVLEHLTDFPQNAGAWFQNSHKDEHPDKNGSILSFLESRGDESEMLLPIHMACQRDPPKDVIQELHQAYPVGMSTQTNGGGHKENDGMLPIFLACLHGASLDVIQEVIASYPDGVHRRTSGGLVPLHVACMVGASLDIIIELVKFFPGGVAVTDDRGRTPLDYVKANSHANKSNVMRVLKELADRTSMELPTLHQLISNEDWEGALTHLQKIPEEAWCMSSCWRTHGIGFMAIHAAPQHNAPQRVIQALCAVNPAGPAIRAKHDMIPLHYALSNGNPTLETVQAILDAHREAVWMRDTLDLLPVQMAFIMRAPFEVINAIIETHKALEGQTAYPPVTAIRSTKLVKT